MALANQLPSAAVFIAATMRHFLIGDAGNSANTGGARHGTGGMEHGEPAPASPAPGESTGARLFQRVLPDTSWQTWKLSKQMRRRRRRRV